ncbi:MAG: hypothetical protein IJ367_00940 [Clostridia bacterium]|nr:hypothetical protein [Clostridia bacterium]
MTKRDIAELMTILQANYPDSFKGQSDVVVAAKVQLWHDFFKDHPKEAVYAAAKAFIATDTKGFMPNIGQINEQIQTLKNPCEMDAAEAWGYVYRALQNSGYRADEEFAKLPPLIQRVVGSPNQLREWALMDAEIVQSVISSNFQKSFRITQGRNRDFEKLPGDVKTFVSQIANTVIGRLEGGYEEIS